MDRRAKPKVVAQEFVQALRKEIHIALVARAKWSVTQKQQEIPTHLWDYLESVGDVVAQSQDNINLTNKEK